MSETDAEPVPEQMRQFPFGTVRVRYNIVTALWHWRVQAIGCAAPMRDHLEWSTHGHRTIPDAYQAAVMTSYSKGGNA